MSRRALPLLLTLFAALLLGGCSALAPDPYPPFRYRMTVEVETPQGLRIGSAVREVDYAADCLAGQCGGLGTVRGEAVAVDLPGRRTLYALLPSDTMDVDYVWRIPMLAFMGRWGIATPEAERQFAVMLADRTTRVLPRQFPEAYTGYNPPGYPLLVTFTDRRDPMSVVRVEPDALAASFGAGVALRRITVQITEDEVTEGIERRLAWLGEYPEPRLDSAYTDSTNPSLSQRLSHGDFRRGSN
jgi:hypothetical protein